MSQTQQSSSPVAWSTGVTQRLLDIARGQTAVKPMRKAIYAAQLELAAEEQKHLKRIAELEAELAQAKKALTPPAAPEANCPEAARTQATAALKAQAAPNLELTDEELTTIYKTANNEVGKARPLTTESIFKAMRAVAALTTARTLGANHPSVPTLDSIRFGGWCDTHVSPKPCWHCQQVEKREVVAGNQLESRK